MVRCEEFYLYFERKGNFCGKSDMVVKKVEEYIDYVKRNKMSEFGGYKISNCALDPFISIEFVKDGKVHKIALHELKSLIRKRKISPGRVTRRVSVELINRANIRVEAGYQLQNIPGIRSRIGEFEHDIGQISYETRNVFDTFKNDVGIGNNNEAVKIMLECCIKHIDEMAQIKDSIINKQTSDESIEIIKTA